MSRLLKRCLPGLTIFLALGPVAEAQLATATVATPVTPTPAVWIERLPGETLAVTSPATRVRGEPGGMQVVETSCRSQPMEGVRQRIVSIALQEWAYFGFSVADETVERGGPFDSQNPFGGSGGQSGGGEVFVGGADSLDNGDGFAGGADAPPNGDSFGGGRRFRGWRRRVWLRCVLRTGDRSHGESQEKGQRTHEFVGTT